MLDPTRARGDRDVRRARRPMLAWGLLLLGLLVVLLGLGMLWVDLDSGLDRLAP